MAWLDFIKRIRADEEEEKRQDKKGGASNSVFGFLDDVIDTGSRVVTNTGRRAIGEVMPVSRGGDSDYDFLDVIRDTPGSINDAKNKMADTAVEFGKDVAQSTARFGAESFMTAREGITDSTDASRRERIKELLNMDEQERLSLAKQGDDPANTDSRAITASLARKQLGGDLSTKALNDQLAKIETEDKSNDVWKPTAGWQKAIFGGEDDERSRSLQKRVEDYTPNVQGFLQGQGASESVAQAASNPIALVGAVGAMAFDSPFGSPAKAGAKVTRDLGSEGLEAIAKSVDPADIIKVLSKSRAALNLGDDTLKAAAEKLAKIDDIKEVGKLLDGIKKVKPVDPSTVPQVVSRAPTESLGVDGLAEQVARGRLSDKTEMVNIDDLRRGSDTVGELDEATVAKYVKQIENQEVIDPLVVSEKKGQLYIQDGKHRDEAFRRAGVQDVPIVREIPKSVPSQAPKPNVAQYLPEAPGPVRDISPIANEMAAEYKSADDLVNDIADSWYQFDSSVKGGELVDRTGPRDAYGSGITRTSDHTPFYSESYAATKRPPSKQMYVDEVRRQIDFGGGSMVEKDLADAHGLIKNRTAEVASLDQATPPTQQFMDIVTSPIKQNTTPIDLQGGAGRTRTRSFLQTAQNGPITPEAKAALQNVKPQEYTQQAQEPVMDAAKKLVDTDYSGAVKLVNENGPWTDTKSATLMQLMSKAQREGRIDDFLELADQIDKSGREAGRANAILAAWSKMSPEGILRFAKREVDKVAEKAGTIKKVQRLADKLKNEVGKIAPTTDDVSKAIDDAIGMADPEDATKSVGERVANNIGSYVDPPKKKQVDNLVAELTKKIKQEMMAPKPPAEKKAALDVFKETLARRGEADEAWPEAKEILKQRFADNPDVLAQLDEFFSTGLLTPASSRTLDTAIRDTMKANKVKIADTIKKSWDEQITDTSKIAQRLTENGFSADDARTIAEEVGSRVKAQIATAKKETLDRMLKTAQKKTLPSYDEKIAKLSNVGALDDADYLEIAQKQLGVASLDAAHAAKISELAQKMQGMPDGEAKNKVIAEIMETIADTMPITKGEKFNAFRYQNLLSSPRTQLRNVAANTFNMLITRPATLFTGAVGDTMSSVTTNKARERMFSEIPEYYRGLYKGFFEAQDSMRAAWQGKVDISNPDLVDQFGSGGGIQAARMKNLPKKWTVVSRLMEAQDRMFSGMIAGGEYAAQIQRGIPPEEAMKAAHGMAEYSLLRQALDPKNATGQGQILSAIDRATQGIVNAANWLPGGRWIVPFVRTPLNFGKQWLEFSPLGLANATVGDAAMKRLMGDAAGMSPERKLEALNKGLLGTSVVGLGTALALDDKITWSVPENQTDRDLFYAEGKKPYSVKVGENWIPLINFGPFGLAMSLPAAYKHNFKDSPESTNDNVADKMLAATLDIGEMLSQQTFLNGVGNVIEAVQGGNGKEVEKVLAGLASQVLPLSGLVRYISTAIDPTYREAEGFVQTLQRDIPFLSKGLEAQKNSVTGEDVTRNASDYVAPYSVGMPNKDENRQANTEMSAEFYRSIRRGTNDRTKTNEAITKALSENNPTEAVRLTTEHNQRVVEQLMEFDRKWGKRLSAKPELQNEFRSAIQSALIPLSQQSVNSRLKNQAEKEDFSQMLSR